MDYKFSFNEYNRPLAEFTMGHEAIGRWFSEELSDNKQRIDALLDIIQLLEENRIFNHQIIGAEFQLRLSQDEIVVIALALEVDVDDELPEDMELYDEESFAECGLQDFKQAVNSWHEFVCH